MFINKCEIESKELLVLRVLNCDWNKKPLTTFSAVITKLCAEILPTWIIFTKHVQIPRFEIFGCVQSL
jgi:hypothetical protein